MADEKEIQSHIVVGDRGISVSPSVDVKGDIISEANSNPNLSKGEQPLASEIDPPASDKDKKIQLRQLTEKAVLCAMERLNELLLTVKPTANDLMTYMEITLKLLDAKEAFEWADAFRAAILKNPKLMSPNGKGLRGNTLQTRTNATIAQRLDRGDTRTTPKKLLSSMPGDDDRKAIA